jgi:glycerophosphoryl diester phosphodiesterase
MKQANATLQQTKEGILKRALLIVGIVLLIGVFGLAQEKIVIGHRGAAGYLPEHTLAGYAFAYALGADYVEPDLVLTNDAQFICLHDIYLEPTTDVEQVFPDRHRSDGHWYAADFTLTEIKTLSVHERCKPDGTPYFPDRFPVGKSKVEVPTFTEMIELIQGLNNSTGRNVGIYPELKRPSWHASEGLPMEKALLDVLSRYGYTGPEAKVYVQSFEPDFLKKLRELGAKLPLVQLISGKWSYSHMWTQSALDEITTYANAIGPSKTIIETNPEFIRWAHDRGLAVHPYTFRKDQLPEKYTSLEEELKQFYFNYDVDGLFTDFVDIAVRALTTKEQGQ